MSEYSVSDGTPGGIATAADGTLWFTAGSQNVDQISTSGTITSHSVTADSWPTAIAKGPSGRLRVTLTGASEIATMDPSSGSVTSTSSTTGNPWDIVQGPSGSDYFSETSFSGSTETSWLGVVDSSGTVTEYELGSGHQMLNAPGTLAYDPNYGTDGTVFFVDAGTPGIGAFDIATDAFSYVAAPSDASTIDALTLANDGTVWFTENSSTGMVGQYDPATAKTIEYPSGGSASDGFAGIIQGPGGDLWLADQDANTINHLTSGAPTTSSASLSTAYAGPVDLVEGPDGNVWATEEWVNQIARIKPDGTVSEYSVSDGTPVGSRRRRTGRCGLRLGRRTWIRSRRRGRSRRIRSPRIVGRRRSRRARLGVCG